MSLIIHSKEHNDESLLMNLLTKSTFKLAETQGKNSITVDIECDSSYYERLHYDERSNEIKRTPLNQFVMKIVFIADQKSIKKIPKDVKLPLLNTEESFNNETLLQKRIFLHSLMIDCQLKGICPDLISSFFVESERRLEFLEYLGIKKLNDIHEHFIEKGIEIESLKFGCIIMERLDDVLDKLGKEISQELNNANKDKNFVSVDEKIKRFFMFKANSLICLDKLHYIGISHRDVKPDNIVSGLLIDFGLSVPLPREIWPPSKQKGLSRRLRQFNNLDFDVGDRNDVSDIYADHDDVENYELFDDIPDIYHIKKEKVFLPHEKNKEPLLNMEHCLFESIYKLENEEIRTNGKCIPNKGHDQVSLCDYYNFSEKKRYTTKNKGNLKKETRTFTSTFAALTEMNFIDRQDVIRGGKIRTLLENKVFPGKNEHVNYEVLRQREKELDEFVKIHNFPITPTANSGYYKLLTLYLESEKIIESCKIILTREQTCITVFQNPKTETLTVSNSLSPLTVSNSLTRRGPRIRSLSFSNSLSPLTVSKSLKRRSRRSRSRIRSLSLHKRKTKKIRSKPFTI
jgi:serine/threonine protein kinase